MDDMLVKSQVVRTHINDFKEAFATLQKYKIKLNPIKYAFRVTSEKFLSFMVSRRRIEANLEKIKDVQEMTPPRTIKDRTMLTLFPDLKAVKELSVD